MAQTKIHKAWRFGLGRMARCLYVAGKRKADEKGDAYHYTTDESQALLMSVFECQQFCRYMRDCDACGFWA